MELEKIRCILQCTDDGEILFDGSTDILLKSKYGNVVADKNMTEIIGITNPVLLIKVDRNRLPA